MSKHPASPDCADDCPTWLHSKAPCTCLKSLPPLHGGYRPRPACALHPRTPGTPPTPPRVIPSAEGHA